MSNQNRIFQRGANWKQEDNRVLVVIGDGVVGRQRIELGSAPSDGAVFILYTTRPLGERKVSTVVRELFARAKQRSVAEPSN